MTGRRFYAGIGVYLPVSIFEKRSTGAFAIRAFVFLRQQGNKLRYQHWEHVHQINQIRMILVYIEPDQQTWMLLPQAALIDE